MIKQFKERLTGKRLREAGGTLTTFIMLFPVIFSVFGLALDVSLAASTKTALQSAMDTATQTTLSQAKNPQNANLNSAQPQLNSQQAYENLIRYYDLNRVGSGRNVKTPFLKCQTAKVSGTNKLVSSTSACKWSESEYSFTKSNRQLNISYTVKEQSATIFMSFLKVEKFTYTIKSNAKTGFSYEQ